MSYIKAFTTVLSLTATPIVGSVCHPVYLIVNASVLGNREGLKPLAGFGLASLTLGICVVSV